MSSALIIKFHAYLLTEKRVSHNTFAAYKKDIDQFLTFIEKRNVELLSVTLDDIKKYLHHLHDNNLRARSVARKISSLKMLFSYLSDKENIKNIVADVQFPKIEKKLPTFLSEQEIESLFKVASNETTNEGIRNKVMVYLLYVSGMRITELINVCLSDIHFDTGFITIKGKGGKERMIPMPQPIQTMLKKYINTQHRKFRSKRKTDFLFPVYYAGTVKAISRQAFWLILKKLCEKTGIKHAVSPHQLRHSFATHMLKRGADLRSLQLLLGHENLATVQIYTHVETSYLRKVYDKKHPRS